MSKPKLSVVVTTKNESANIGNCLTAFREFADSVELIVVDNSSTDDTKRIAAECGAKVLDRGPERSAQRNLGWQTASAEWVVILDADMILPPETIREMLGKCDCDGGGFDAFWVPEVRTGEGLRTRARNFERSFYDGTCIDGLRLMRRRLYARVGGYDERLFSCEDWELDIRVIATGAKCALLEHHLIHNERRLTYRRMLEKKAYYTKSFAAYRAKWPDHPSVKKQFSPWYRFVGVFVEHGKWKKLLRHPILTAVMYFDRLSVGLVYLVKR